MANDAVGELTTVAFVDHAPAAGNASEPADAPGPDELDALLTADLGALGGAVSKRFGTGLALTFHSPRQAVQWAVEARDRLGPAAARLRVGITTGEVGPHADDDLEALTATAGRIAVRGGAGDVVVADVVRQLVRGTTPARTFRDLGRVRLVGGGERWHLWAVDDHLGRGAAQLPTVGRGPEIDQLRDLIDETVEGTGHTVLIRGEAGIGKSHLARMAAAMGRAAGLRVLEVTVDEVTRRPGLLAWAVADVADLDEGRRASLRRALSTDRTTTEPTDHSYAVVEACLVALETWTTATPALLVLEDAHWADDLTLTILRAAIRQLPASGLSVIVTARPLPSPPLLDRLLDPVDLTPGTTPTVMRLGPLDDGDVVGLSASVLGAAPGPNLRQLLAGTGGNALFVMELLRGLDDEGLVELVGGIADVHRPSLPGTLHDTLVRRLGLLEPATRQLLRLASLFGSRFSLIELAELANRPVIDVAADLRQAAAAGLIGGEGDRLTFRHDVVRDAVYDSMLEGERRDLHRSAALALAATNAPASTVAAQFARAARPGDLEAVTWLDRAADEILSLAPSEACHLYEQACALATPGWPGLPALQAKLVEPLAWCGRFDDAQAIASSLLAGDHGDAIAFAVTRGMAAIEGNQGRIAQAVTLLDAAAAVPGAPGDEAERLTCFRNQLEVLLGTRPWEEAVTLATRTLERGRAAGDATTQCVALQVLAVAHAVAGFGEVAGDCADEAVRLLDSGLVRPASYIIPDAFHAGSLLYLDRVDDALRAADASRSRHELAGTRTQLPLFHMIAGSAHFEIGAWDDCLADADAGRVVSEDTGSNNFVLYFAALEARVAVRRGAWDVAEAALARGAAHLGTGTLFGADVLFDAQAELLAARGDVAGALALAELVWAQAAHIRHFYGSRPRAVATARWAARSGRTGLLDEVVRAAAEGAERSPVASAHAVRWHCQAFGDDDPEHLRTAIGLLEATPFRPHLATAWEDLGVLLLDRGDTAGARHALDEAAAVLTDLGALGDLARVQDLLTRAGATPRPARQTRPVSGWDALTPTESTVARLVADGLSNPDIGERLFISRRTVESHVAHIFRKLDLSSRAQLAAAVVRRDLAVEDP